MGTWKTYKLGDVADVVGGGTPKTSKAIYWDGDVPWITPKDLSKFSGRWITRGERNISALGLANSGAVLLPKGTVLVSSRAPVGYVALAGCELCTNQGFKSLVPHEGYCPAFLYYLLKYNTASLKCVAKGSTFPELSALVISEIEFAFPPLEEQERIAGVLGAYDDLIAVNERRMTLLEEAAHRLYRDRFVTHADPTWERKPLSDVCTTIQSGGTPSRSEGRFWESGTIDWFKTKELEDNWLLASEERITEAGLRQSSTRLYPAGTILMAIYASPTLGRLGVLDHEATCNQAALGFVVDETLASRWWLFHTLRSERDKFNQVARGAGQQNISGDIVQGWEVPMPPPAVMRDFEEKVGVYWEAARMLSRENALLRAGRDKLVPRLLREEA